jgi:uncharacterized membrane protein
MQRPDRLVSIDIARGAVMALMALDHVRVYAGVAAGSPDPVVFFTRWVTHFCAPAFFFLAGTSAYLQGQRLGSVGLLSKQLAVRGLVLILLEFTILRFAWTFNFDYPGMTLLGVIWALGASMVLLAALVRLPITAIAIFGLVLIVGHNAVGGLLFGIDNAPAWLHVLYTGWGFTLREGGWNFVALYTLVPWVGVMAAGYAFGRVMQLPATDRRSVCTRIGIGAVAAFLLLRLTGIYGDPWPMQAQDGFHPVLALLNTAKYPASLQFLLMTLGPLVFLLPRLETMTSRAARWVAVLGEAPMFFYVLHIPLIHVVAVGISMVRTPEHTGWLFGNHPVAPPEVPAGYTWGIALLYGVTIAVVVALYVPCRWYATRKADPATRQWWMRYV